MTSFQETAARVRDWFSANRLQMSGNGVWFAGGEPNTMAPDQYDSAGVRILIVRLSEYSEVAAGITHSYLYQMAASVPGCYADLAFLPPERDEKLLRNARVALLTGTSSKLPAQAFDIVAISNSVLQELLNLPALLHYSGLPLSRAARDKAGSPLILLGGSNSSVHSILHGPVDNDGDSGLVDGIVMGDGETVLAQLLELVRDNRDLSRAEMIALLRARISSFYDPGSFAQTFAADGSLSGIAANEGVKMPVPGGKHACRPDSETFSGGPMLYEGAGSSHVIVSAGCPSFCSFCKESWEQKPYRENTSETVIAAARSLKAKMGLREISLMTFNANTCSDIFLLVERLSGMFERVAIKSQRFDAVVNSPELLDMQFDAGKRTYTCAMEGISERLRTLLQKNLDERTILTGIDLLLQRNMRQMKVFLIVTGYEQQPDLDEFKAFLEKVKSRCAAAGGRQRLTFSLATLFRAPQTPMQYAPVRNGEVGLRKILNDVSEAVTSAEFEARISSGPEDAMVSEFIAFADRRHTPILVEASIGQDLRYRGEISARTLEFWRKSMKKLGLKSLIDQQRDLQTVFPWDDVDTGISRTFLWQTWQNLQMGKEIRACLASPWGGGRCSGCGACASPDEIARLTHMGPEIAARLRQAGAVAKHQLWLLIDIPQKWAFCSREFIKAALARRLMLNCPTVVDSFLDVELVEPDFFSYGRAIAKLSFAAVPDLSSAMIDHEDDISLVKILKPAARPDETAFPVVLEAAGLGKAPDASVAREIDALLVKYSLKNQKQRQNGWLNWQVNPGQARRAGIDKISLEESSGVLRLRLIRWPELFMLNRLAGGKPYLVSLPGLER